MARSTSPSPGSGAAASRAAMTCRNADLARVRSRSCIIDGGAVCCDDNGMPSFDRIRYRDHDASVFLYAFDLIELDGDDLRRHPLAICKATLARCASADRSGPR